VRRWLRELACRLFGCDAELKSWKARLSSGREIICLYMECKRCDRRWSLDD
jgi:hypothetical protein